MLTNSEKKKEVILLNSTKITLKYKIILGFLGILFIVILFSFFYIISSEERLFSFINFFS